MLALARLMRCAIVASGTRKAWVISAVVRPPTARKVRAIAEDGVREGWQHMKNSVRVSSWSGSVSTAASGARCAAAAAASVSRRRRASSLCR